MSTKVYELKINGLKESIDQATALEHKLAQLEARLNALNAKGVKTSGGGGSSTKDELSAEARVLDQIEKTERKIEEARSKSYNDLVKAKDELKQIRKEANANTAGEKLVLGDYDLKTLDGMREKLIDLKRLIARTDTSSSEFGELVKDANELNEKIKEVEQSYGVFSRNVGNYASAAQGFKGFAIEIGGVKREFDSATQAAKELKKEMSSIGSDHPQYEEIHQAYLKIKSDLADIEKSSPVMDNLLDTMQSFVAIASTVKGVSALFGFDNDKIEETIKKLVALQNVLNGIETIQKQIQTREGIGKWLAAGSSAVDKFTTGLLGSKAAAEGLANGMKTATMASKALSAVLKGMGIGLIISLIVTLVDEWDSLDKEIQESIPWVKQFGGTLGALEGILKGVGKAFVHWFINPIKTAIAAFKELKKGDFSGAFSAITEGLKNQFTGLVDAFNDGLQDQLEKRARAVAAERAEELKYEMDMLEAMYGAEVKYTKKYIELQKQRNEAIRASINPNTKDGKKALKEQNLEEARQYKERLDYAKEQAKKIADAENELTRLRIRNMKEGLNKELSQLEEQRKEEISAAKERGIRVGEAELEINTYYANEKIRIQEEYAKKVREIAEEMYLDLQELEMEGNQRRLDSMTIENENSLERLKKQRYEGRGFGSGWGGTDYNTFTASYGVQISIREKDVELAREYVNLLKSEADYIEMRNTAINDSDASFWDNEVEKAREAIEEFEKINEGKLSSLFTIGINKDIKEVFNARMQNLEDFYGEYNGLEENYINKAIEQEKILYEQRQAVQNDAHQKEVNELDKHRKEMNDKLTKSLEEGIITQEDYDENIEKIKAQYYQDLEDLDKLYREKDEQLEREHQDKIYKITSEKWSETLQEFRDYQTAIASIEAKSPVYNKIGILNVKETQNNDKEYIDNLNNMLNSLINKRKEINKDYNEGIIDKDVYQNTLRELDRTIQDMSTKLSDAVNKQKDYIGEFFQSIQTYVQYGLQVISQITDLVAQAEDQAYQERIDSLDKFISKYEEMLDKQEEITQEHSDKINDIESELSTARGDRRQELIDQLNAQKAAQRASLAEEKRIEKEKEKLEKQKEREEIRQKKREQNRSVIQAIINAASAAASGFATQPFIPVGLAMGTLASALGLAQVAIIKSQKFAKGGMLQGRSHSQGGIPVGNTGIEVEGNEYVVRKETTTKNVDLLDYINNKQRKLRLEDFIDFYGGKVGKNIRSFSPNAKYADGGILPTLRDDIDVQYGLQRSLEMYANKPTVVSVVDINSAQERVKRVQTLAGLNS